MRVIVTTAVLALALAGCSQDKAPMPMESVSVERAMAPAAPEMADAVAASGEEAAPQGAEGGAAPSQPSAGAPMLAYVHGVGLEIPARSVRPLMTNHEQACRTAGLRVCQVINSSINAQGEDQIYGNITLRAEPRWLETFRNGLEGQARDAGGRLREQTVTSEDLTRQIIDTSARLNAQKTLRDRLQQILRTRPGRLADLLETERELARVQGDIDSAESQLAVMRERVNMSLLNLSYASKPTAVTGGTFDPVISAMTDFFGIVMQGLGGIIRLIAFAIPVALVLAPLGWLALRWRRGRKAKTAAEKA